ncbi:MAG: glycogen/starch/alpha-glucan phosphorylase [Candidatus Scalindua sp. AMX11]|nr:MAG: glycogen/starch/alpha-glucan phosphorylase [Candidatus Scalindua sp.]NOG83430.1 glycogen/starch/alpha-glucan phosphorylase [Planctomycetota bacterium]RZV75059.1 MAG: glycogen/starch/alpha-glucan phosphorylase [Candidatus Scalindua sp. SCAELEC01]TDE64320.1 MAG: glycogen/starch/alpha-glucan phosphorylase [Candidatus Scalindua sp. AMX11]GJQ60621.1 MAG: alpha-1,4 glucan phosphorylase [Candidatus Scalindua sp.]
MNKKIPNDVPLNSSSPSTDSLKKDVEYHLKNTLGLGLKGVTTVHEAVKQRLFLHLYKALALALRDKIMDKWITTNQTYKEKDAKQLYYLSAEYLPGRFLANNMINLQAQEEVEDLLKTLGLNLNEIEDGEMDAGLGTGGLGRLASCFLDSIATLQLPGHGYGLRYDYGIFRQDILNGYQVEHPDQWLQHGNPWEIQHEEDVVIVTFGGSIKREDALTNKQKSDIEGGETVSAIPFDTPIVGFNNNTVNTLKLWSTSVPDYTLFDIKAFDQGDYEKALKNVLSHDDLTMVSILYPNDNHDSGKRLRLKQQYILVSASIQDIIRTFKRKHPSFDHFHQKVAIQINDTHPSLVVTELMRILVDQEGIEWDQAWDITVKTCAYTNHTVLSEALERWDVTMMQEILPRNFEIIEIINHDFCVFVGKLYSGDMDRVRRVSIVEDGKVKMANLAIVGSHSVNGVAELHTQILKEETLLDFYEIFPEKFNCKTNGITPRRWLLKSNPELASLITDKIGNGWVTDLSELEKLEHYADDDTFLNTIMEIKHRNKERLKDYVYHQNPVKDGKGNIVERIEVDQDSIFDVQAKRLHEYKRQLLNALHILMLYNELKDEPSKVIIPRTFFFAAKSAPGYEMAKAIIKFINVLAHVINNDQDIKGMIKIVFLENYNVSLAEILLTAADVSEQISTAGLEASGTGNMKLALNGALTIGTMDGANVEMSQEIGEENMFIFGLRTDEVKQLRESGYNPADECSKVEAIQRIIDQLYSEELTRDPEEKEIFKQIADSLVHEDKYFILKDLIPYKEAQDKLSELYRDKTSWAKKVVLNIARSGKFSSDRTINQYNDEIWHLSKIPIG